MTVNKTNDLMVDNFCKETVGIAGCSYKTDMASKNAIKLYKTNANKENKHY